jgi:acetyl esterase/lipase
MFAASLAISMAALAQPPAPIPLWEGKVPFAVGDSDTDKPSLTIYKSPAEKANGTAVLVCPGGGYGGLANDHEGKQIAEFLNGLGVSAFVLKYRTANKERPGPLHPAPLTDAQRALRLIRSNAKEFGVDPGRIGIWGFSAGGHLASSAGTHFDGGDKDAKDPINRQSCRPDFMILSYPVISMQDGVTHDGSKKNLLGPKPDEKLVELMSNEKQVTKDTPPTFIFHTTEDVVVKAENAILFYLACKKSGVPVEMHIYEKGRHGVGLGRDPQWTGGEKSVETWPERLKDWMKMRGLLEPRKG